jgi:hypothetical protein
VFCFLVLFSIELDRNLSELVWTGRSRIRGDTHTALIWEISTIAIVHFTKGTLEYNALKSFMKKKNLTALGCEINSFAPPGVNHISKRMIFNEIRDGNQRLSHDIKDVKDSIDGVKDVLEKILARLDSLAEDRHRDHSPRRPQKRELQ